MVERTTKLNQCQLIPSVAIHSQSAYIEGSNWGSQRLDQNFRRILIVRTDRIGDVILTLPMARVLKNHSPSVQIAFLIQRYTSEIIESNPDVDQVIYYDNGERTLPFFRLVAALRRERFDVVFHTHPMFRLALITRLARIPVRVGTGYRWYSILFNRKVFEHRKDARKHELEYNLDLLESVGCPAGRDGIVPTLEVGSESLSRVKEMLARLGVGREQQMVLLHPGSGGSARDWSADNFGLLGRRLAGLPHVRVVIAGSASEDLLVRRVWELSGKKALLLAEQLSLREYAALTKLASLFIANSTGPLHIAAAVGTPVIGLYPQVTPLNSTRWGPYTKKKTIFSPAGKPVDCSKCVSSGSATCECMDTIRVEDVFQAALSYLPND
jgi:lipopolysaccharide heptosyltransferase II